MTSNTDYDGQPPVVPSFVCPNCKAQLEVADESASCVGCGASFPIVDGIVTFCSGDDFYEGKWVTTDMSCGSLRNKLIKKERFFNNMLSRERGSVLDLGCAGGWKLYTTIGPVVGLDLSLASLHQAATIYSAVARAELNALPFADNSFDFVVASDLLGHIPFEDKDSILSEIYRVLRPGGRVLQYIETDGRDPLMKFARQYPELYDKYIVQPDGHIGMESPIDTCKRFRRIGFQPIKELPAYKGLTYVGRMVQYFDNEYSRLSKPVGALVGACKALKHFTATETAANLVVSGLIEITDAVAPQEWAGGLMVCYEKPHEC